MDKRVFLGSHAVLSRLHSQSSHLRRVQKRHWPLNRYQERDGHYCSSELPFRSRFRVVLRLTHSALPFVHTYDDEWCDREAGGGGRNEAAAPRNPFSEDAVVCAQRKIPSPSHMLLSPLIRSISATVLYLYYYISSSSFLYTHTWLSGLLSVVRPVPILEKYPKEDDL